MQRRQDSRPLLPSASPGRRTQEPEGVYSNVKIVLLVAAIISVLLCVVMTILKLDGSVELDIKAVWATLGLASSFLLLFFIADFLSVDPLSVPQSTAKELQVLQRLLPNSIQGFHQTYLLRDILLCLALSVFVSYGLLVFFTECEHCRTPYQMLSMGIAVTYFLRLVATVYNAVYEWWHLRLMVTELRFDPGRMYEQVSNDLDAAKPFWWWWLMECTLWMSAVALIMLGTIWIQNKNCADHCAHLFHSCHHFITGLYAVEGVYLASLLFLRYYRRTSGVETVENIVTRRAAGKRKDHEAQRRRRFNIGDDRDSKSPSAGLSGKSDSGNNPADGW